MKSSSHWNTPYLTSSSLPRAIFLALKYRGGQFARAWFIIAAGFVLMAVFDLAYTYLTNNTTGGYLSLYTDHIYIGKSMILAIGAMYLAESVRGSEINPYTLYPPNIFIS